MREVLYSQPKWGERHSSVNELKSDIRKKAWESFEWMPWISSSPTVEQLDELSNLLRAEGKRFDDYQN